MLASWSLVFSLYWSFGQNYWEWVNKGQERLGWLVVGVFFQLGLRPGTGETIWVAWIVQVRNWGNECLHW